MGRINNVFKNIEDTISTTKGRLNCDWDDGVKESYFDFFDDVSRYQSQISDIVDQIESVMENINNINIESLVNDIQKAIQEASE